MATRKINDSRLSAIGNAIRAKNGTLELIAIEDMPDAIMDIETEPTIESKNIDANGTYTAPTGVDGFSPVVVNVPNSYSASDEGKVVDNGELVAQTSRTIDENGTYDTTTNNEVVVDVEGGSATLISKTITENGTYDATDDDADGYSEVTVDVEGGSVPVRNFIPYVKRPISDVGIERGNRERGWIIGGTVAWNQLVADSGSDLSVTIQSGHYYVLKKNNVWSVGESDGTAITGLTGGSDMLFDLTAMFGSTMADYIYSLEQSTAGAGVEYFRNFFPNNHYGYNDGELMSVNTSAHKTVGKNLLCPPYSQNSGVYSGVSVTVNEDNSVTLNGQTTSNLTFYLHRRNSIETAPLILPKGTYILSGIPTGYSNVSLRMGYSRGNNGATIGNDTGNGVTITEPDGTNQYGLWIACTSGATFNNLTIYPMIRYASVTDASFEPYEEHIYPLDSDLTLRGIPKLDADNNLVYDGDVYEYDGTVTRNYTIRAYQSGDESLADAITDGTNTVVKLVTPTTESADPYKYVQKMDVNGTEQFVDTRSVAIPVGHETEYYQMDANLVSKTITENGTYDATGYNVDGCDEVVVEVENSYSASDEGKVVDNGELVAQGSKTITQNGTYDTTLKNEVIVDVEGGGGGEADFYAIKFTPNIGSNTDKSGGWKFIADFDTKVKGVRFFARETTASVYISDMQGNTIASKTNVTVVADQWNDVLFDNPITLSKNGDYVVWGSNATVGMQYESKYASSPFIRYIGGLYSTSVSTFPSINDKSNNLYGVDLIIAVGGGSGSGILSGDTAPSASLGSDGDLYVQSIPIPSNINFVEYLQGHGTEYIDTGLNATEKIDVKVDTEYTGNYVLMGVRTGSWTSMSNCIYVTGTGTSNRFGIVKAKDSTNGDNYCVTVTSKITLQTKTVKVGDKTTFLSFVDAYPVAKSNQSSFTSNGTMILFGARVNGSNNLYSARLCRVVIFSDGVPIKDYLPCLDANDVPCMWDNIAQEYVYNDGTGTFTYGSTATPNKLSDILYVKENGAWEVVGEADGVNT